MNLISGIKIPHFIVYQILSAVLSAFVIWRSRRKTGLKKESIYDFIFINILISILIGRLIYIAEDFNRYRQVSWSVYPYYYDPGSQRVWFKQMPWIIIKFWDDNINYSALLLGSVISHFLVFYRKGIKDRLKFCIVKAALLGQIIQVLGFFVNVNYYGKVTDSFFSISYPGLDGTRIPLQFLELFSFVLILLLAIYLDKIRKSHLLTGIFLFLFGWLEIVIEIFKDRGPEASSITFLQVLYLIMIFIGILLFIVPMSNEKTGAETSTGSFKETFSTSRETQLSQSQSVLTRYRGYDASYKRYKKVKPSPLARLKRILTRRKTSNE